MTITAAPERWMSPFIQTSLERQLSGRVSRAGIEAQAQDPPGRRYGGNAFRLSPSTKGLQNVTALRRMLQDDTTRSVKSSTPCRQSGAVAHCFILPYACTADLLSRRRWNGTRNAHRKAGSKCMDVSTEANRAPLQMVSR